VHKDSYTFMFAAIVTVVCSVLLTAAATLLKSRQQENMAFDMQRNILNSVGIGTTDGKVLSRAEVLKLYDEYISSMVIDLQGNIMPEKRVEDLNPKKDIDLLPLYNFQKDSILIAYIIPISGKGLWSTIYGYLALEADAITVRGITFYKHGETPGLGGEIEKDWFKNSFIGKKIISPEGGLVSITVVKGKVKDKIPEEEQYHFVDGISGSTLTGDGLTHFLKENLLMYDPFFQKIRKNTRGDLND
jgi:Na+-transporting NADH:ubiquinone oxidoreductase subunit C